MKILQGHKSLVTHVGFTPDGRTLASAEQKRGRPALLWDTAAGTLRKEVAAHWARLLPLSDRLLVLTVGHSIDAAGAYLWSCIGWDAATGARIGQVPFNLFGWSPHALSPDGRTLAIAGWAADRTPAVTPYNQRRDWCVNAWDVATMTPSGELVRVTGGITALAYSSDGRRLMVAGDDERVRVYDLASKDLLHLLRQDARTVQLVASADGGLVAEVLGRRVVVWDAETWEQVSELRGHAGLVRAAEFVGGGRRLITAGMDGTARVWDPEAGVELSRLDFGVGKLSSLAVAPDGSRAAAGGQKKIVIWDLE